MSLLVVQWLPNAGLLDLVPSQGTRPPILQLKGPCAATKTQHGQKINK